VTTPATRRTTPSRGPRPSARRHSPTASTTPARESTAASAARAADATATWTQRPTAASSAPTPDTRSRPACRARHPPGSGHASDRLTRRSSQRTPPPSPAVPARRPASRQPRHLDLGWTRSLLGRLVLLIIGDVWRRARRAAHRRDHELQSQYGPLCCKPQSLRHLLRLRHGSASVGLRSRSTPAWVKCF
jgi:hypothetical protein